MKFTAMARTMIQDADASLVNALSKASSGVDQYKLTAALQFLRQESAYFQNRFETLFREGVDRALRTMYTDLRQGLSNLSANNLSLIDDETVNRQLEVGHLVQRLRDACNESLGRLNMMIAQIHGDPDVHERENPYRPFLIARALHEALKLKVTDEEVAKLVFEHLANSLANHLSDFYASICEVFDASGVEAKLQARPTKLKRHQRDQLAQQLASMKSPANVNIQGGGTNASGSGASALNFRVMPSLQRMFELLQKQAGSGGPPSVAGGAAAPPNQSEEFQEFVWNLFNQQQASATSEGAGSSGSVSAQGDTADSPLPGRFAAASADLLKRLDQFQQLAASGQTLDEQVSPDQNQLFALSDKLSATDATQGERMAIDVIAVLFEFILEDEQIPAEMRVQIGRLQIPFLKAAMLAPALLHDVEHPARKLLNRISSAVVGLDSRTSMGAVLAGEVARLVKRVLQEFDKDVAIFTDCLDQFEQFLAEQLPNSDSETAKSVQALEALEEVSLLTHHTSAALHAILTPLAVDERVVDFITRIWARVLVRAVTQETAATSGATMGEQYREILPELVWSAQDKESPQDRSALIKLLPGLVKRLKIGMLMIRLSEDECKEALDQLVAVHTRILRANQAADAGKNLPSLDDLRREFSRLIIDRKNAAWTLTRPLPLQEESVESALAGQGVEAELDIEQSSSHSVESDAQWLSQIALGTSVQFWVADTSVPARAIWISKHNSLYIFKMEQSAKPLVYSAAALVKALREGAIRLIEYAPAFDRAVDALMAGAETLQAGKH